MSIKTKLESKISSYDVFENASPVYSKIEYRRKGSVVEDAVLGLSTVRGENISHVDKMPPIMMLNGTRIDGFILKPRSK
jgi:hypothetical protein